MYQTQLITKEGKHITIRLKEFEKYLDEHPDLNVTDALKSHYNIDEMIPVSNYLELKRVGQTICKMTERYYPSGRKVK